MEIKQSHFLAFFNALVDGDKNKCAELIQSLVDNGADLKDIYVELYQKSLYRIGKLWDHNELTIPEEHMATQITESLISKFAPNPPTEPKYKALVTCIDKEFHEIGAKMVSHVFELNNWKTYYLGASIPTKENIKYVKQIDPNVIAISWSLYLNLGRFLELVDHLTKFYPTKKIVVGGQALNGNSDNLLRKYSNVKYISTLDDLDSVLKMEFK